MKIMVTSFQRSRAHTAKLSAPNPATDHCQPTSLPETPGHSQASVPQALVGSLILSPGSWCTQAFVCAPKTLFPQSCVSSGSSMMRLVATSSMGAYATPRAAAPRAPAPAQSTADPYLCRRHSNTVLSQSLCGFWVLVHTGTFEPSEHLWQVWSLARSTGQGHGGDNEERLLWALFGSRARLHLCSHFTG